MTPKVDTFSSPVLGGSWNTSSRVPILHWEVDTGLGGGKVSIWDPKPVILGPHLGGGIKSGGLLPNDYFLGVSKVTKFRHLRIKIQTLKWCSEGWCRGPKPDLQLHKSRRLSLVSLTSFQFELDHLFFLWVKVSQQRKSRRHLPSVCQLRIREIGEHCILDNRSFAARLQVSRIHHFVMFGWFQD